MVAGIAIDNWKLSIFERRLEAAGYAVATCKKMTDSTLFLRVETDDLKALEIVVRAANAEAARGEETMPEELMKRPSISDDYVRRRAAEIVFPKVWGWMGREYGGSKEADVMCHLMKVAGPCRNGYELSKDLEHFGWAPDDLLVEILSDTWVQDAIDELTAQWVRCLGIRPQFKIGDTVAILTTWRRGDEGIIVRVDERLAKYGVRFEEMPESSWTTINFEDCSAPVMGASPNPAIKDAA